MLATVSNLGIDLNFANAVNSNYVVDRNTILFFIKQLDILMSKITIYQILTLVVTLLGVIVNFLVVKTALLQYRKKIKLEHSAYIQMPVGIDNSQQLLMFSLKVKNYGYCNIKLCQWGFTTDKKTKI